MKDEFFVRLVPSEVLVIKTSDLSISLKKVSPSDVKGLRMEEGPTKFQLPENLGNVGDGNVNAKVSILVFFIMNPPFSRSFTIFKRIRISHAVVTFLILFYHSRGMYC